MPCWRVASLRGSRSSTGTCPRHSKTAAAGWSGRTADAFGRYAEEVVKRLGDRVKHWFTVNEIPCFIGNGYGNGYFAPGLQVGAQATSTKPITTPCSRTGMRSRPCGRTAGPGLA